MTTTETPPANGNPTGTALERKSPTDMVKDYQPSIAMVLPSHVKPDTWIRIVQSALKRGPKVDGGRTQLEVAAENNPAVFMATVMDAARLGLEVGTEEYYLTPRKGKGGRDEILGIVGYQGYIELMYRAGAVDSVVAECVYENDEFAFRPGVDVVPQHEIEWKSEDRGELVLVYAFARMKGGAISKVVVLNKADIARIKAKAQNPGGQYSPWRTDPPSMWLKSAVRQLRKWVPTSPEWRREQLRAERDIAVERGDLDPLIQDLPHVDGLDDDVIDVEEVDDDIVDADVVEPDETAPPARGEGGGEGEGAPAAGPDAPTPAPSDDDFPDVPVAEPAPAPEPEPEAEAEEPEPAPPADDPPKGTLNAQDVARYARQVFKSDYDAAPNGQKTKVVERLRHAIVFAQSGGKAISLSDIEPGDLFKVNQRLRDIAGGKLLYEVTDEGVTLTYKGSDRGPIPITWAQIEALETAAAAT